MTTTITTITDQLSESLRRPTRRTLTLINKALSYLQPFESALARTVSAAERRELLELVGTHRMVLSPYLNVDSIESNLRNHTFN